MNKINDVELSDKGMYMFMMSLAQNGDKLSDKLFTKLANKLGDYWMDVHHKGIKGSWKFYTFK